ASGGAYKRTLLKQDHSYGSVKLGLSPSLTFDSSCYFYSLNVTFVDNTYAFYSVENCYNLFTTSYLILYAFIVVIIIVLIIILIEVRRSVVEEEPTSTSESSSEKDDATSSRSS
ncbi:hypothetical protein Y032_1138g3672, partial [Ancylostoma ceylanicum]